MLNLCNYTKQCVKNHIRIFLWNAKIYLLHAISGSIAPPFNGDIMPMETLLLICLSSTAFFLLGTGIAGYLATKGVKQIGYSLRTFVLPRPVRNSLKEARYYGHLISKSSKYSPKEQLSFLDSTIQSVRLLLANLDKLEQSLERLYMERNIKQEIQETITEMQDLQKQLEEAEGRNAQMLDSILKSKEKHLNILNELQSFCDTSVLTIRQSASLLNSTHAEITLLTSKGALSHRHFHRLNQELKDNSESLTDLLEVMEEMNGIDKVKYLTG